MKPENKAENIKLLKILKNNNITTAKANKITGNGC